MRPSSTRSTTFRRSSSEQESSEDTQRIIRKRNDRLPSVELLGEISLPSCNRFLESRLRLGRTARLVGIGLIAGLVLASLGALIRSLLYQVQPLDPTVLVTASAVIFGLALLVSLRPALQATRVDLTRSLR